MNARSKVVSFAPLGSSETAKDDETLLDVARRASVPLGSSCGGVGICTRCRVRVLAGSDNLSGPTSVEARFSLAHGFATDERMACQAIVRGDCEITTTYW